PGPSLSFWDVHDEGGPRWSCKRAHRSGKYKLVPLSPGQETNHGMDRPFSVSTAVRLHGFVSHYLSFVHDRACGLAHGARSILSDHRKAGLSPPLRILAQDIRRD